MGTAFEFYVLCAKFFADVIKANGVTISNRVDMPNSPVIYEAEATIFRNSPLVRKAIDELAEEDGLPEPFSERLEIRTVNRVERRLGKEGLKCLGVKKSKI